MKKLKIALMICLIVLYFFMLWQFDHTIAPIYWANPSVHQKCIDGWFLGYLSGVDVYNTLMLFLIFVPISLSLCGVLLTGRFRWSFNSHESLDPPKWKVWVCFIVIVLTDLYSGVQLLLKNMDVFDLVQAIVLLFIHALLMGFTFLQKEETEKEETQ